MVAGNIRGSSGDRLLQQNQVITVKAIHHGDTEFAENFFNFPLWPQRLCGERVFLIHSSDANALRLQPKAEAGNTPRYTVPTSANAIAM